MRAVRESDGIIEKSAGIDDECRGIRVKRDGVSGNRIAQDTCFSYRLRKRPEIAGCLVTAQDKCMVVTARDGNLPAAAGAEFFLARQKIQPALKRSRAGKVEYRPCNRDDFDGNMFLVIQADIVCENGECLIKRGR